MKVSNEDIAQSLRKVYDYNTEPNRLARASFNGRAHHESIATSAMVGLLLLDLLEEVKDVKQRLERIQSRGDTSVERPTRAGSDPSGEDPVGVGGENNSNIPSLGDLFGPPSSG